MRALTSWALTITLGVLLLVGCELTPPASAPATSTTEKQPVPARTPADRIEDRHERRAARRDTRRDDRATETPDQPADSAPADSPTERAQADPMPVADEPAAPNTPPARDDVANEPESSHDPTYVAHPLRWKAPEAWKQLGGGRTFRKATYVLPRSAGDKYDGELAVWHFGQRVEGVVEANLRRWRNEFTDDNDQPIRDDRLAIEEFDVGTLHVRVYSLTGRYRMRDYGTESIAAPRDGYALRVAIVETPHGPWLFRVLGPAATLAENDDRLLAMLRSIEQ